jgi:acetate kinase
MPGTPQVAVFDTAFHMTMPPKAYIYAIPYEYYENDELRRYGFHGTSHRYVSARAIELLGNPEHSKVIVCHLGNGSSLSACVDGKCVDTTMGLGPLAGVPMGTRCGDIDGTIIEYLMGKHGYSIQEMMNILNKKSGVLGISGVSSDFRDLESAAEAGNERAQLALDKFHYEVRKSIGAYAAAMGGVDAIVFTAGIGENGAIDRAEICEGLEYLGVNICPERNAQRADEHLISTDDSNVKVFVIATNEELMIARDTKDIVSKL